MTGLLTNEKVVRLNVKAETWEESIREAGALLENEKFISKEYIDKMVNIVKEYGPYIVVFENVALAHAQAGTGVFQTGASLITLHNPVVFGNPDNDPVSIVIALASVNHSNHLQFLRTIMDAFSKGAKEEILEASSEEKIIELFNQYSEENEDEEI